MSSNDTAVFPQLSGIAAHWRRIFGGHNGGRIGVSWVDTTYSERLAPLFGDMEGSPVSELIRLIDDYRDRHGQPSESSIARAIGTAPQTVNSWRKRGIREMPSPALLAKLAELLRVPMETVVLAAARDAGYLQPREGDEGERQAPPIGESETG